ncbi:MAG: hypothetical protein IPK97_16490 [Ahniella sp.]|nr:hypothetical protein [Ahniella sp.]
MNRWTLLILGLAVLAIWGGLRSGNPLNTALPFGTTDLSTVQAELEKLEPTDRQRVEAYVQRTNGDYLPAGMGDPDDPVDAKTFAQAIERQKQHEERMKVGDAEARARQAERDVRFKPLRDALGVAMVKREMLTHAEIYGYGTDMTPQAVTTFRLTNRSNETIVAFDVKIDVRELDYPPTEFGILVDCWLEEQRRLAPGDTFDVRCGRQRALTTVKDAEFLTWPTSDMDLRWEPKRIRFEGGRELVFRD